MEIPPSFLACATGRFLLNTSLSLSGRWFSRINFIGSANFFLTGWNFLIMSDVLSSCYFALEHALNFTRLSVSRPSARPFVRPFASSSVSFILSSSAVLDRNSYFSYEDYAALSRTCTILLSWTMNSLNQKGLFCLEIDMYIPVAGVLGIACFSKTRILRCSRFLSIDRAEARDFWHTRDHVHIDIFLISSRIDRG